MEGDLSSLGNKMAVLSDEVSSMYCMYMMYMCRCTGTCICVLYSLLHSYTVHVHVQCTVCLHVHVHVHIPECIKHALHCTCAHTRVY